MRPARADAIIWGSDRVVLAGEASVGDYRWGWSLTIMFVCASGFRFGRSARI